MSYLYQPATVCPSCARSIPDPDACAACERYADAVEVTLAEMRYHAIMRVDPYLLRPLPPLRSAFVA